MSADVFGGSGEGGVGPDIGRCVSRKTPRRRDRVPCRTRCRVIGNHVGSYMPWGVLHVGPDVGRCVSRRAARWQGRIPCRTRCRPMCYPSGIRLANKGFTSDPTSVHIGMSLKGRLPALSLVIRGGGSSSTIASGVDLEEVPSKSNNG